MVSGFGYRIRSLLREICRSRRILVLVGLASALLLIFLSNSSQSHDKIEADHQADFSYSPKSKVPFKAFSAVNGGVPLIGNEREVA